MPESLKLPRVKSSPSSIANDLASSDPQVDAVVDPSQTMSGGAAEHDRTTSHSKAEIILAAWREVELSLEAVKRDVANVEPESPVSMHLDAEWVRLVDDWAHLRLEHKRLIEAAPIHLRQGLPAWPEPWSDRP